MVRTEFQLPECLRRFIANASLLAEGEQSGGCVSHRILAVNQAAVAPGLVLAVEAEATSCCGQVIAASAAVG